MLNSMGGHHRIHFCQTLFGESAWTWTESQWASGFSYRGSVSIDSHKMCFVSFMEQDTEAPLMYNAKQEPLMNLWASRANPVRIKTSVTMWSRPCHSWTWNAQGFFLFGVSGSPRVERRSRPRFTQRLWKRKPSDVLPQERSHGPSSSLKTIMSH